MLCTERDTNDIISDQDWNHFMSNMSKSDPKGSSGVVGIMEPAISKTTMEHSSACTGGLSRSSGPGVRYNEGLNAAWKDVGSSGTGVVGIMDPTISKTVETTTYTKPDGNVNTPDKGLSRDLDPSRKSSKQNPQALLAVSRGESLSLQQYLPRSLRVTIMLLTSRAKAMPRLNRSRR